MVKGYNDSPGYDDEGYPVQGPSSRDRSFGSFAIRAGSTDPADITAQIAGRTLRTPNEAAHAGAHHIADTAYENWLVDTSHQASVADLRGSLDVEADLNQVLSTDK